MLRLQDKVFPVRYAIMVNLSYHKGTISRSTLHDLVGVDTRNKFLETNIFAFHIKSREITFQSTVMKQYLRGKIGSLGRKMNKSSPSDYRLAHGGSKPLKLEVRPQSGEAHG